MEKELWGLICCIERRPSMLMRAVGRAGVQGWIGGLGLGTMGGVRLEQGGGGGHHPQRPPEAPT